MASITPYIQFYVLPSHPPHERDYCCLLLESGRSSPVAFFDSRSSRLIARLPSFGSSIPLLPSIGAFAVGLTLGIEDGEILGIRERACKESTCNHMPRMKNNNVNELEEDDTNIGIGIVKFVSQSTSPYAFLTLPTMPSASVTHPWATCTTQKRGCGMIVFRGACKIREDVDSLDLVVMSANGEQPRTPLILTISTMHREVFISGTMALILQVTVMFRLRSLTQVTLLAYFATRNHRSHHLPATPSATQTMIQLSIDGRITIRGQDNNGTIKISRHYIKNIAIIEIEFRSKHGEPCLEWMGRSIHEPYAPTHRDHQCCSIGILSCSTACNGNDNDIIPSTTREYLIRTWDSCSYNNDGTYVCRTCEHNGRNESSCMELMADLNANAGYIIGDGSPVTTSNIIAPNGDVRNRILHEVIVSMCFEYIHLLDYTFDINHDNTADWHNGIVRLECENLRFVSVSIYINTSDSGDGVKYPVLECIGTELLDDGIIISNDARIIEYVGSILVPISSEDTVRDKLEWHSNITSIGGTIMYTITCASIGLHSIYGAIYTTSCGELISISMEFDSHSSTGSAYDYNDIFAMDTVAIYADQAIECTRHDIHLRGHHKMGHVIEGAEHIISIMMPSYNNSDVNVCISNRITIASNSIGSIITNIGNNNVIHAIITNDNINVQLSDGRVSDHVVTNNHESMSHINLDYSDTSNVGYEMLTCIDMHDYGMTSNNHTHTYVLDCNNENDITSSDANSDCMNTKLNTYDRLSSGDEVATNIQPWIQDRVQRGTNNNMMHDNEM